MCLAIPKMPRGPCQHYPKKGCPRCQVINLTPPKRVKAWGDCPAEASSMFSDKTYLTGSMLLTSQLAGGMMIAEVEGKGN